MNDIFKHFLDLSNAGERKAWAIAIKVLYYLNCLVLAIWLTEYFGYKNEVWTNDFSKVFSLFMDYYIVIPVFSFLAVTFSISIVVNTFGFLASKFIRWIDTEFMEKISLKEVFKQREILNENLQPEKNYLAAFKRISNQVKRLDDGMVQFDYYLALIFSIGLIYQTIIYQRFSGMHFWTIFILMIVWFVFVLLAKGLLVYIQDRASHALMILQMEKSELNDPVAKKTRKLSLVNFLNLRFPKN